MMDDTLAFELALAARRRADKRRRRAARRPDPSDRPP
ncbi:YraN family protein, partial [Streptomyces cavourensis]